MYFCLNSNQTADRQAKLKPISRFPQRNRYNNNISFGNLLQFWWLFLKNNEDQEPITPKKEDSEKNDEKSKK